MTEGTPAVCDACSRNPGGLTLVGTALLCTRCAGHAHIDPVIRVSSEDFEALTRNLDEPRETSRTGGASDGD